MKYYSKLVMVLSVAAVMSGCGNVVDKNTTKNKSVPVNTIGTFIVVDYSGSMAEEVNGGRKCDIVKRNMVEVGYQMDKYLKTNPNSNLYIGMILMHKSQVIIEPSVTLRENASGMLRAMAKSYLNVNPDGGTPLGIAMEAAWKTMKDLDIRSKNIIVLTDGESNCGKSPDNFMQELKTAYTNGSPVGINFLAFDVNSACFNGVKNLGATVVSASNEKELNEKMEYILREKILLEKEE